ncbi:MAG: 4-alpha-glucanotransferase [Planctomycetota bacterium]|nr:4-alpha-glucanotransferase [Planctomycetota bacterium]
MRLPRASGILLHPTSLPGRFGIGDLGPEAEKFVDHVVETGQKWWQMLPLGPTGFGNSPYQSHSSYAGNALLISPERLVEDGWLDEADLADYPVLPDDHVDFDAVSAAKHTLFLRAFARIKRDPPAFVEFQKSAAAWLDDYALYMALKYAHDGKPWEAWEPELIAREPAALEAARASMAKEIHRTKFIQFLFHEQWERLRGYCHLRNVGLIGDLPIFVSGDSSDVWARPDLFELDANGKPTVVAGVPPDYFSEDGQLWGNPLYKWSAHQAEGFAWWIERMKGTIARVDLVRLDHFRGFAAYWAVPADAPTAATGRWVKAPGHAFLTALREGLGGLPLLAEDLGDITPDVIELRDAFNLPGMRILQFAFGDDPMADEYLPYKYIGHCVVYTGTHDNDTTVGWFTAPTTNTTQSATLVASERAFVLRFVGSDGAHIHWDLIRVEFSSVADTTIVPMQDILGLDGSARMNIPGHAVGNWKWRFRSDQFDQASRDHLADLTAVYDRWNGDIPARWRSPRRPKASLDAHDGGTAASPTDMLMSS